MTGMQIRVVATGSTPREHREKRWGLSLLIGETVLFDTFGMADLFLDNLRNLDVDISRIRHIVLSHEHWDHVNGLEKLAERNRKATVYMCPHTDSSVKSWVRGMGLPVVEVDHWLQIEPNIFLSGEIPGGWNGNPLWEQVLVISRQPHLSVLTGCAHPGLFSILQHVRNRFAGPITLLMGGFHLMNSSEEEISAAVTALRMFGVQRVAPTHCTGETAVRILKGGFAEHFIAIEEGDQIRTDQEL